MKEPLPSLSFRHSWMPISNRLEALGNGVFARTDEHKRLYRNTALHGGIPDLIDLSLGSSDLPPPAQVLQAMAEAMHRPGTSSYCLHAGTAPFRQAVAAWCQRRFGVEVDPEREVQLLIGSQEGTAHLPLAILNPGDSALMLDPSYPSHRGGLVLAGAEVISLRLDHDTSWLPRLERLSLSTWERIKLFVLGYPHNPTARVGNQALLDQIMALGCRHDTVIANDNPYVDLALEGQAPTLLHSPGWRQRGIEFFSLSKGWCLGGFRLAFAVGAEPLIAALRQLKGVVDFNQSLALQQGAICALEQCQDWPAQLRDTYRKRRDGVVSAFLAQGWRVPLPEVGMYIWMPMPARAVELGWGDERCASELLERSGVALTPGSGFGAGGRGWLRMALVRPLAELHQAVTRLVDAHDALA